MTTEAKIQVHVNKGYRIAAKNLGHLFAHYRAQDNGPVLVNFNMVDELNLAFDRDKMFSFASPEEYKSDTYYALLDLTTVGIGDYLYDFDKGTFFIANIEPLKPAMLIRCSHVVTISRPASNNGYGGDTGPIPILTQWPCSIFLGPKGEKNIATLPESTRSPWIVIHIPQLIGTTIEYGDIVIDELNRRYAVSDNHLTPLGWYLTCEYVTA